MRIVVTRSGGFGGLTRTWSLEVSRTEAEQRWLPLAEAEVGAGAEVAAGPEAGVGTPMGAAVAGGRGTPGIDGVQRDRFTYRITIGYTEVHLPESGLGDPWRELIDRARAATSARQSPPATAPVEGAGGAGPGPSPELL